MMLLHTAVVELLWSRQNATDNELMRAWESWPVSALLILATQKKFEQKWYVLLRNWCVSVNMGVTVLLLISNTCATVNCGKFNSSD